MSNPPHGKSLNAIRQQNGEFFNKILQQMNTKTQLQADTSTSSKDRLESLKNHFEATYPSLKFEYAKFGSLSFLDIPCELINEAEAFKAGWDSAHEFYTTRIKDLKEQVARVDRGIEAANDAYQRGYKEGHTLGIGFGKKIEGDLLHWKGKYETVARILDKKITEAKNEGYSLGIEAGRNAELAEAIIPSDAYNVEVFAIKPADDGNGEQAFIGYQFKCNNTEQFRFVQVKIAVTNPSNKYGNNSKINEDKGNKNIG